MKFKKKVRCPYCDGKIKFEREERLFTRNLIDEETIMLPKINTPFCISCGEKFQIAIKTEGELEIILEDFN